MAYADFCESALKPIKTYWWSYYHHFRVTLLEVASGTMKVTSTFVFYMRELSPSKGKKKGKE